MEAKPLLIIHLPKDVEQTHDINHIKDYSVTLTSSLNDYHVLLVKSTTGEDFKFEAFYPTNFDEIEFERFKQIATEQWN